MVYLKRFIGHSTDKTLSFLSIYKSHAMFRLHLYKPITSVFWDITLSLEDSVFIHYEM